MDSTYVDGHLEDELPTAQVDAVLLRRANQLFTVQVDDADDEDASVRVKWLVVP